MVDNIYIIVAITEKTHSIGKDNDMIYHLKEDLEYFKNTTINNTIVCGRKTYFSFPKRPLPNRKNIVLTRSNSVFEGAEVMHSVDEVIEYAKNNKDEKIFICGGDQIYSQFIDIASRLYITFIKEDEDVIADSHFPAIDMNIWRMIEEGEYIKPSNGAPEFKFTVFERK